MVRVGIPASDSSWLLLTIHIKYLATRLAHSQAHCSPDDQLFNALHGIRHNMHSIIHCAYRSEDGVQALYKVRNIPIFLALGAKNTHLGILLCNCPVDSNLQVLK